MPYLRAGCLFGRAGQFALVRLVVVCAFLFFAFNSCRLFEYAPYAVPSEGDGSRTDANLDRLLRLENPRTRGGFSFAVISDTHLYYDQLVDAVNDINADTSIRFVFAVGDLTQGGILKEYELFTGIASKLSRPYLTVIGNHDALANGIAVYQKLFGSLDYSFQYQGVKFVCFNDNVWEFPPPVPDTAWLKRRFEEAGDSLRIFTVSHIPPFGDQFDAAGQQALSSLQARHHVALSIHAHLHNHLFTDYYDDGVPYLVVDDIGARNYDKITVLDTGIAVERVFF